MAGILVPLVNVVSWGGDTLRYQAMDGARANPLVLNALAGAGAQVVTLSEVAGSLEEIYLSLIASEMEDDAGQMPVQEGVRS